MVALADSLTIGYSIYALWAKDLISVTQLISPRLTRYVQTIPPSKKYFPYVTEAIHSPKLSMLTKDFFSIY